MNQNLFDFAQYVLELASDKKTGLIPVYGNQISFQQQAFDFTLEHLKDKFSGFLVFKNNKYPEDDLKELDFYLKPNTVIMINHISNSFQYSEILELAKKNLIIVGFECFCSLDNSFYDFTSRFHRVSHIEYDIIKQSIPVGLFCYRNEIENKLDYKIFKQS